MSVAVSAIAASVTMDQSNLNTVRLLAIDTDRGQTPGGDMTAGQFGQCFSYGGGLTKGRLREQEIA
jgi:hypothetical protein